MFFDLQMVVNAFSILDQEMNSIGTGIYLGVSITDHSCKPNAVATFDGTTLYIRTIENMWSMDWSKVNIFYQFCYSTIHSRFSLPTDLYIIRRAHGSHRCTKTTIEGELLFPVRMREMSGRTGARRDGLCSVSESEV